MLLPTLLLALTAGAQPPALAALPAAEQEERLAAAAATVLIYRQGLQRAAAYAADHPELVPAEKLPQKRMLPADAKREARETWRTVMEFTLALDAVGRYHDGYWKLKKARRGKAFLIYAASFLAGYRSALDFLDRAENDPGLHALLDEAVPETGLPKGSYARYKFRFLNAARAAEYIALQALLRAELSGEFPQLRAAIEEDSRRVLEHGLGRGEELTARNALKMVEQAGFGAWFPVQAGVAEWMGDTKVLRRGRSLVSQEQIAAFGPRLEPGDILLERREWFISNIGLPGYWPHAALYTGTPEQRRAYFADKAVEDWARKEGAADFEALLSSRAPRAYAESLASIEGHPYRVLEAISEGVSWTTLEHSADADAVAVLRPRLSKKEKAEALLRAFGYQGRPYDFDFDFGTDASLVCTELVYKSYEPAKGYKGVRLPLTSTLGRWSTPANLIARMFDFEAGTKDQQLDFVLFLDGKEKEGKAVEADILEFRRSWLRPKWHIILQ